MNADAFRHFYGYHFNANRTMWDTHITPLSDEQFTQPEAYSIGSVRAQVVHLMSVDDAWFSGLRGVDIPEWPNPADFEERAAVRARWDSIERTMQEYLAALTDEMLLAQPLEGEDEDLYVWQVLLHVVNHGTDHRAQLLRVLHDLGAATQAQDYIFYVYRNP